MTSLQIIGKDLISMDTQEIANPEEIIHLDISLNQFRSGKSFLPFQNLKTLICDQNQLSTLEEFPLLSKLDTFVANKNYIKDLDDTIDYISKKFPNLQNLSLLKNPCNPFMISSEEDYLKYRVKIMKKLPNIRAIDGMPVSQQDIEDSKKKVEKVEIKKEECKQELDDAKGTVEYNSKYSKPSSKTIKSRSEGNRFVKNEQL